MMKKAKIITNEAFKEAKELKKKVMAYLGLDKKILARKYKLLNPAYNVFLTGVFLSVMAFTWVAFKI